MQVRSNAPHPILWNASRLQLPSQEKGKRMKRNGRPPKEATGVTTLTIKIPAELKNKIIELSDGYDMTITEYIATLVLRDASPT